MKTLTLVTFHLKDHGNLFLYTDGLVENEWIQGKIKPRRLISMLAQNQSSTGLKDAIHQAIQDSHHQLDDLTCLVIHWRRTFKNKAAS